MIVTISVNLFTTEKPDCSFQRKKWAGAVRKCAFEVLVAAHVCGVRPRPDKAAGKLELSVLLADSVATYQKLYTLSLLVDITYLGPRSAI